ncbi:MAG: phage tail protein, partial [Alphaproteobacteria bacterium]|nr:phage tail protein [Alphaproteobacteria bacterium]
MSDVQQIYAKYKKALTKRTVWDSTWEECYEFALPQRESTFAQSTSKINRLFDGTAPDCVDQLAALMLSEMTPPWGRWFQLTAGSDLSQAEFAKVSPTLEKISDTLQAHFD